MDYDEEEMGMVELYQEDYPLPVWKWIIEVELGLEDEPEEIKSVELWIEKVKVKRS